MHRLLKRQLKKVPLKEETIREITPLLDQIDGAYRSFDTDLHHVETILEKSSQELYEANQKLKESVSAISGRLSKIAGNINEVIFEMDLKGHWSYLNPAWEKLTGLPVADAIGRPFYHFLKDEEGKPLNDLINLKCKEFSPFSKNLKCLMPQGFFKWIDFSVKPIKSGEGNLEGFIGTIIDISFLKETERELILAKEKETKANKAKDEFLSTMSHEIRTPLNAVIGVSHLLLMEDPKKEQLENLKALKYSSEHLLGLVNDILDFNKISSGSLQLEHSEFSLEQILNGLYSMFYKKAKAKNISFVIKRDNALPGSIMGDTTRVTQILTNLVNNAIKFTEKGRVVLDIELLTETDSECEIRFEIRDTGIGIPLDKRDAVFQSFAQANTDTTRKYGGTGLGLAICKQLVEIMNGELTLESEVGKGSVFSFALRFDKPCSSRLQLEDLQADYLDEEVNYLEGCSILVVEDNRMNTMVVQKLFARWKINLELAENGLEGVKKAHEKRYDIILMDLEMPVMNGFDASRSIRQTDNSLCKDVPIYALSASAGVDVKQEIKTAGMNGFIGKPFKPDILYKKLSNIMIGDRS
jgi:PAS domain S-box-containing protein